METTMKKISRIKFLVRIVAKTIACVLAIFVLLLMGFGWYFSAPAYEGATTAHFDGRVFRNEVHRERSFWRFLSWITTRKPGMWSDSHVNKAFAKPESRVMTKAIRTTFVNHATVLIQVAGVNILTDPIWSERCSPVSFAGPKRVRAPGVRFDDLPPIDIIIVSHNHYDHLDLETLQRLRERDNPQIFVGLGNKLLLEKHGFHKVTELDWWDHKNLQSGLKLWSVPAQHFSGRGLVDRNKTLWTGFVIESPNGVIFFAGDTGFGPHFGQIHERFGDVTVAVLPIGAFMPREIMRHMHMNPDEALQAAQVLRARHSIGVHFGTFRLADDAEDEPIVELKKAQPKFAHGSWFLVLDFGESRDFYRHDAAGGNSHSNPS